MKCIICKVEETKHGVTTVTLERDGKSPGTKEKSEISKNSQSTN